VKKLHSSRNFLGNCRHEEANDNNLFMLPVASLNTDTQWLCAEKKDWSPTQTSYILF